MTTRKQCETLAAQLGCELEIEGRHVTIWLPKGQQIAGNPGLDCYCTDGESMTTDVWPTVYADLKSLVGGMEPLDPQ